MSGRFSLLLLACLAGCAPAAITNRPSVEHAESVRYQAYSPLRIAVHAVGYLRDRSEMETELREAAERKDDEELLRLALRYGTYRSETPVLTAPPYPLDDERLPRLLGAEKEVVVAVERAVERHGYQVTSLYGAAPRDVDELLNYAEERGADAVLVVRFVAIDRHLTATTAALETTEPRDVVRRGLGFVPTFELYDTRSKHRIYHAQRHCWNDLARPLTEQVCSSLFVPAGENLERRAAERVAALFESSPGLPILKPSTRDEEAIRADGTNSERLFWSPEPWARWQLGAGAIGASGTWLSMERALPGRGSGAGLLAGVEITSLYFQYRNLGIELAGFDLEAGSASGKSLSMVSLVPAGLRYLVRLHPRLQPFFGGRVANYCLAAEGDDCRTLFAPSLTGGLRWETPVVPVDFAVEYVPALGAVQAIMTFHVLGLGTRPYPLVEGELAIW